MMIREVAEMPKCEKVTLFLSPVYRLAYYPGLNLVDFSCP